MQKGSQQQEDLPAVFAAPLEIMTRAVHDLRPTMVVVFRNN
jgi:hypothetical protein